MTPLCAEINNAQFEHPDILHALVRAHRFLAELKGVASSMPNQDILINALGLREAKDSSEIENIITTHDDLFREMASSEASNPAAKEVARYRQALGAGFLAVRERGLLTINQIVDIQAVLQGDRAGIRKLPGTVLKDGAGFTIYTPPSPEFLPDLLGDLERFINDESASRLDPLIKMAVIHHQFESIHPFYDGNGRTGRIMNVLYLVKEGLLDAPVLYLSRAILRTRPEYYRLLQDVRARNDWTDWVAYMLDVVEETAKASIQTVHSIRTLLFEYKHRIRSSYRFYSQDLINNLFSHPYTKIEFLQRDLGISRLTATRYLETLADDGLLEKRKIWRHNYYINPPLYRILTAE